MSARIVIADEQLLVCETVSYRLCSESNLEVVGCACDGWEAMKLIQKLCPDVVLSDTHLPKLNGIDLTRKITHLSPHTKVIALSAYSDKKSVHEMFRAGASGYVLKQNSFSELLNAIGAVILDNKYLAPEVSTVVMDDIAYNNSQDCGSIYSILTDREREVLQLLVEGKSTKEIAIDLFLSAKTVDWHRSQIMKKLKIDNVVGLVKYAINEGLIYVDALV